MVPSDLTTQWSVQYETLFQTEFNQTVAVQRERLAPIVMEIPLGNYQGNTITLDWLGAAPQMREWVDEKREQEIGKFAWSITPKRYEASVAVDMDAFMDARGNIYEPRLREMGQNGGRLRYTLVSSLISGGAAAFCYDGQYFFDTDHSEGDSGTQSNKISGAGTASDAAILGDFYKAKAALNGFKDDKGQVLSPDDFRPLVWLPNDATLLQRFYTLGGALVISQTNNVLKGTFDMVVDPTLTGSDWYMFRTDRPTKPFVVVNREDAHYEDNFDSKSDDVFKRRKGMASVVARMGATYGLWQHAVMIDN